MIQNLWYVGVNLQLLEVNFNTKSVDGQPKSILSLPFLLPSYIFV